LDGNRVRIRSFKIISMDQELDINEEFKQALNLLNNNSDNLFITGNAGTGKSTLLSYFRETTKKKVAILAPTGVAALNIEGQTIHSFFKLPPNIVTEQVLEHKLSDKRKKLIAHLDMIIIDEASMLRADLLDCIDVSLRHHRQEETLPFGGVQMIFIGDLYQLPPVVSGDDEREIFRTHYSSPYFFSAKALEGAEIKCIELAKIYRQNDNEFINLLNKVRNNTVTFNDLTKLNERHNPDCDDIKTDDFVITLTTTNAAANEKNQKELEKLETKSQLFLGEVDGDFEDRSLPTSMSLELKEGAQVMMLSNDYVGGWVNGSIGKIIKIEFDDLELDDVLTIKLDTGKEVKITKHSWRIFRYFFNEETQKLDTEITGSFTQYPLRLAWAVTIHKSQGKTFDKVVIDIGKGAFAHGQVYVALSRCRSLEGITLKKPIQKRHIWSNYQLKQFFRLYNTKAT